MVAGHIRKRHELEQYGSVNRYLFLYEPRYGGPSHHDVFGRSVVPSRLPQSTPLSRRAEVWR
jgi:hypothetical protein